MLGLLKFAGLFPARHLLSARIHVGRNQRQALRPLRSCTHRPWIVCLGVPQRNMQTTKCVSKTTTPFCNSKGHSPKENCKNGLERIPRRAAVPLCLETGQRIYGTCQAVALKHAPASSPAQAPEISRPLTSESQEMIRKETEEIGRLLSWELLARSQRG